MSAIPSNLSRVPLGLSTRVLNANITRTSVALLQTEVQLSSGLRVMRPSDDAVAGSLLTLLDKRIDERNQSLRNLEHAESSLNTVDAMVAEASDIMLQSKEIAATMIGATIDSETRAQHAEIVQALIDQLFSLSNSEFSEAYLFGGSQAGRTPVEELIGGYRYTAQRDSFNVSAGPGERVPLGLNAHETFGTLSSRVEGDRDLVPTLTGDVRVSDLDGADGLGVTLGVVQLVLDGTEMSDVDLTGADSVDDVMDMLTNAIGALEADSGLVTLGAGGISINSSGTGFAVDVEPGMTIEFRDIGSATIAADLGLAGTVFDETTSDGRDLNPRITELTPLAELLPAGDVIEDFVITNGLMERTIRASEVTTVLDLQNLIEDAEIGIRLEINDDGRRLNLINELSGLDMSAFDVAGGDTAEQLGILTFTNSTELSDFNFGRGVSILSGNVDPVTGVPDPQLDRDFRVTLSDGTFFDVDLAGALTAGDVVTAIASSAPATFTVALADGANGFELTDLSGGTGNFSVTPLNGSLAATDLGLLTSTSSATIAGEDRAKVRVEGVFTHLIALRDALMADDDLGITFAGEGIEEDIDRLARARGIVGQRARRVGLMMERDEQEQIMDASLKSQLRDLDYTEAAIRLSSLQLQLQAALTTTSQSNRLSLINFLG